MMSIAMHVSLDRQRLMELAHEKGASSWLTAIPLKDHGSALLLEMLYVSDLASLFLSYQSYACVARASLWSTP